MTETQIKKPAKKKAPKLEALFKDEITQEKLDDDSIPVHKTNVKKMPPMVKEAFEGNNDVKQIIKKMSTTVYFPEPVKDQLEEIQFSERKTGVNQNDLILEGIDLLFKKRGFPSIKKLLNSK